MEGIPVDVVIEAPAACADLVLARAALREALLEATAPRHGGKVLRRGAASAPPSPVVRPWVVTMRREPRVVHATIEDDAGRVVAERTVAAPAARGCVPSAKAIGAWAALVLDDERSRGEGQGEREAADPTEPTDGRRGGAPKGRSASSPTAGGNDAPEGQAGAAGSGFGFGASRDGTFPDDDHGEVGPRSLGPRPRTFEIGALVYLRNGVSSTGGMAGVAPFATVEVVPTWFVRPGLSFGSSLSGARLDPNNRAPLTQLGARLDFCKRIPGNYVERRGVELDLCGGGDVGHVVATYESQSGTESTMAFRASVGPSATLRGEVGNALALEVRGVSGWNLARRALLDEGRAPDFTFGLEAGMSVRFP